MASDHDATFLALRKMLRAHAAGLTATTDTPSRFCLEAVPGPATLSRSSSVPISAFAARLASGDDPAAP